MNIRPFCSALTFPIAILSNLETSLSSNERPFDFSTWEEIQLSPASLLNLEEVFLIEASIRSCLCC